MFIKICIDNIILAARNEKQLEQVKEKLSKQFDIKDLGELKYFLGMKVERNKESGYRETANFQRSLQQIDCLQILRMDLHKGILVLCPIVSTTSTLGQLQITQHTQWKVLHTSIFCCSMRLVWSTTEHKIVTYLRLTSSLKFCQPSLCQCTYLKIRFSAIQCSF